MAYDRDTIILARQAFAAGAEYNYTALRERNPRTTAMFDHTETRKEAQRRYPLPKVTRPRVVRLPGDSCCDWRCVEVEGIGLTFEFRTDGTERWSSTRSVDRVLLTPETVRMWADLLANPTEEVEDES